MHGIDWNAAGAEVTTHLQALIRIDSVGQGPRAPPEDQIDCRGTAYVEDGYMSIAWNERVPDEPDWDEVERDSVAVV